MMAARKRMKRKKIAAMNGFDDLDFVEDDGGPPNPGSNYGGQTERTMNTVDREEAEDAVLWPWFYGLARYVIFIVVFTIVNVAFRPSVELFEYHQLWKDLITGSFGDWNFIEDVWPFLNGPILSLMSPDFYSKQDGYWAGDENQYLYGNRLLGSIRLRQIRVLPVTCPVIQTKFLTQDPNVQDFCFPSYHKKYDEGRLGEPYQRAKDNEPLRDLNCSLQSCTDVHGNLTCCTDYEHFHYKTYEELGESAVDFLATFNWYPGGGYVADIYNYTQGKDLLDMLEKRHKWIDLKTRALFVDFTFYNPNVDLFVVARVVLEFLPSGLVKPFTSFRTLKLISYSFDDITTWPRIVLESVLGLFILWYVYDEIIEIYKALKSFRWHWYPALKFHFSDAWNALEFVILSFLMGVTALKVDNTTKVLEMLQTVDAIDASRLQTLGFWATQESNVTGCLALVLWIKIFRFITITLRLERLFLSIWKAVPDLVTYFLIFGLWIFAFSVSGIVIFGNDVDMFVDMNWAMTYCIRILFGDFDYVTIYWSNRLLGPIWLFAFMCSAVIILLNFFVAILCEVYAEVMDEADQDSHKSIMDTITGRAVRILGLKTQIDRVIDLEEKLNDIDADGDGMVTKVELADFLAREGAYEVFDATEVTEVMSRFDKNGNGYLDKDEMMELRQVLQKRKLELESQVRRVEAEQDENQQQQRGGGGAAKLQQEVREMKETLVDLQENVQRSQQTEKKMMQAMESLATKVDSLLQRETDFKFLRKGIGQDWIK